MPYPIKDAFSVAGRRLERAAKKADEVLRQMRDYVNSGAITVDRDFEEADGKTYVTFTLKVVKPPPNDISLELGEVFHQARAPLDNVINSLAPHLNVKCDRFLGFPARLTEAEFDKWLAKYPFPRPASDAIRRVQPFNTVQRKDDKGAGIGPEFFGKHHPLWILNSLSNQDKHYVPIEIKVIQKTTAAGVIGGPMARAGSTGMLIGGKQSISVTKSDGNQEVIYEAEVSSGNLIESGMQYARVLVTDPATCDQIIAPVTAELIIARESRAAAGAPVAQVMENTILFAKMVLNHLEQTI
jgi:hypothetical protein